MTPNIHPTVYALSPIAGLFAAAAAFGLVAAAVTSQDIEFSVPVSSPFEAPAVTLAEYDPMDFSATVSAFDIVLLDPLAIYEPANATPYEAYINGIAANE